jgi:hypothetical protein
LPILCVTADTVVSGHADGDMPNAEVASIARSIVKIIRSAELLRERSNLLSPPGEVQFTILKRQTKSLA